MTGPPSQERSPTRIGQTAAETRSRSGGASTTGLSPSASRPDRVTIADMEVDLLTQDELVAEVVDLAAAGRTALVAHHNLHSLHLVHADVPDLRQFYARADIVYIDGMALVGLDRLTGGRARREHRHTLLDWVEPLIGACIDADLRVLFLGSAPGLAERAVQRLEEILGTPLQIQTHDGFFDVDDDEEAREVERFLAESAPDLVFVGMGMPRQELWFEHRREHLPPAAYLMVGGLFDYFAGTTATPPRLLGRLGLEWAYRLVRDPRRLWRRYLIEPVQLTWRLARSRRRG